MSQNTLVINCDLRETRVALIEGGVIAELQIERARSRGTVGNIVLGKVTRVLPGMQAAFIDVGMERAAFLHVEDLIKPADFEAYLTGDARADDEATRKGQGVRGVAPAAAGASVDDDDDEELGSAVSAAPEPQTKPAEASTGAPGETETPAPDDEDDDDEDEDGDDDEDEDGDDDDDEEEDGDDEDEDGDDEGEVEEEEEEEEETERGWQPDRTASTSASNDRPAGPAGSRRRRRRRKRRPGENGQSTGGRDNQGGRDSRQPHRQSQQNDRNRHRSPRSLQRTARSVPITEVVKEGDEVIVQVSKEPIGTKGARVTSHISLPGRYAVYLPTVDHAGVSRRIGSSKERARLREVIEQLKPASGGIIVRTVAAGLTKKALKTDIGYLVNLWGEVSKRREKARAPQELYAELDLVLKTARDLFTEDVEKIVIDDKEAYSRLVRFVEMFLPERVKDIELYAGSEPIFDAYGIEDEIARALSRKVPLPSGGYLIIDQAEALTAIDVNTGRYVGKGSKDLEETALKTNLEAVDEIAYQLRFRNIGGLVILDLIDMDIPNNRERVWRALEQQLSKDKAKTTLNRISELGLLEMTRKRTRESLMRQMHEPCFYCDGTGQVQSRTTIAYEILRQIRRERQNLAGYSIIVNAHPAIIDVLSGEEREAVQDAERKYQRRIELISRTEYHIEQFDLQGK